MKRILEPKIHMFLLSAGLILSATAAGVRASVTVPPDATCLEIQQALESLPDSGGEVILSPGTYWITQPVVLHRSHQTLRGSGAATILRLADRANCPVIVMGQAINTPANTLSDLHATDLFIDGNRLHQQFEIWQVSGDGSEIRNNGITVQGVTDSTVERVTAAHCRSGGLVTTYSVRRLKVKDFEAFDSEFDGLACYRTEDSLFTGLNLHNNQAAGISFDLAVNHNIIERALLANNDLGVFMRDSRHNLFRNIEVDQSSKFGVFMAQAGEWTPSGWRLIARSECTNNTFNELLVRSSGVAGFRINDASCVDNQIVSSRFQDNPEHGISLAAPNLLSDATGTP
jgi:nitrous oxidase accessory protein NosD